MTPSYVALGDSYASGTGTSSYISDGTCCSARRTPTRLIAAPKGYKLNFHACSGAKISDVTNNQLGALTTATRFVSISVGGNDAGFAWVMTECAQPGWASKYNGAIDTARTTSTTRSPAGSPRFTPPSGAGRRTRRSSWSATRGSSTARTATRSRCSRPKRSPDSTRPPTC